MKKVLCILVCVLQLLSVVPVLAQDNTDDVSINQEIELTKDTDAVDEVSPQSTEVINVTLNGKPIAFDQSPFIEDGTTLVPLRAVFEALGADVYWSEKYHIAGIVKNDIKIFAQVDGVKIAKWVVKDFDELIAYVNQDIQDKLNKELIKTKQFGIQFELPENTDPDVVISVLRARLDKMGYSDIVVEKDENNMIIVKGEYDKIFNYETFLTYINAPGVITFKDSDGKIIIDNANIVSVSSKKVWENGYGVQIELNDQGREKMAIATENISQKADGEKYIFIMLDSKLISKPVVMSKIETATFVISGNFNEGEAKEFAGVINAGILPFELTIYSTYFIEPTVPVP